MAATEGADLTRTGNSPATAEIVAHTFAHVKRADLGLSEWVPLETRRAFVPCVRHGRM